MTLDIGNDILLYKVFPASLHDSTLSWFHRLPQNSINSFCDVSENIKMQENKSLRDFMKQFSQTILQVENSKPLNNQSRQGGRKQDGWQQQPLRLTLLTVSYKQLIPLIQELPKFKWLESIKTDPAR
ncbi:hypothetical protein AAG906_025350 [Vitis piasezkii]